MDEILFFEKIKADPYGIDILGNNWLMNSLKVNVRYFGQLLNEKVVFTVVKSLLHKNKEDDTIFDKIDKSLSDAKNISNNDLNVKLFESCKKVLQELLLAEIDEKKDQTEENSDVPCDQYVNSRINKLNETLLLSALDNGNFKTVLKLLDRKDVDTNVKDNRNWSINTHIFWFLCNEEITDELVQVMNKLIQRGYDICSTYTSKFKTRILFNELTCLNESKLVKVCDTIDLILQNENFDVNIEPSQLQGEQKERIQLSQESAYEMLIKINNERVNKTLQRLITHPKFDINKVKKCPATFHEFEWYTPLVLAVKHQRVDLMMEFLTNPALNINYCDERYNSAISMINAKYISTNSQWCEQIVKVLLSRNDFQINMILDQERNTLLLSLIKIKNYDLVEAVIERKDCNISYSNMKGISFVNSLELQASQKEISERNLRLMKKLIALGHYDINTQIRSSGRTLLVNISRYMYDTKQIRDDLCEVIDLILDREECNVNCMDFSRGTAYSYLVSLIDPKTNKLVKKLIGHPKFDFNVCACEKDSPLILSFFYNNIETSMCLLDHKSCNLYQENEHHKTSVDYFIETVKTPFLMSSILKKFLERADFDVNRPLKNGNTLLIESAEKDLYDVVNLLLDQKEINLDVGYVNKTTKSSLMLVLLNKIISGKAILSTLKKLISRTDIDVNRTITTTINSTDIDTTLLCVLFPPVVNEKLPTYDWLCKVRYDIIDTLLDNPKCDVNKKDSKQLSIVNHLADRLVAFKQGICTQDASELDRVYTSLGKLVSREDFYPNFNVNANMYTVIVFLSALSSKHPDEKLLSLIDKLISNPICNMNLSNIYMCNSIYYLIRGLPMHHRHMDLLEKVIKRKDFDIKAKTNEGECDILSYLYRKTSESYGYKLLDMCLDAHINDKLSIDYIIRNSDTKVVHRALSHPRLKFTNEYDQNSAIKALDDRFSKNMSKIIHSSDYNNLLSILKSSNQNSPRGNHDDVKSNSAHTSYADEDDNDFCPKTEKGQKDSIPLLDLGSKYKQNNAENELTSDASFSVLSTNTMSSSSSITTN